MSGVAEAAGTARLDQAPAMIAAGAADLDRELAAIAAEVTADLGEPGEPAREPWFAHDAMRTEVIRAGRIEAARGTVDAWLERAAAVVDARSRLGSVARQATADYLLDRRAGAR